MKILVLTKRQYMGKDLLDDRYGRFHEIPHWLAMQGNQVTGVCLSYKKRPEYLLTDNPLPHDNVSWHSINLGRTLIFGLYRYLKEIDRIISKSRPDIIYTCSDAIHAILGNIIARKHSLPYVVDLYDNFESYDATRLPGIYSAFRRSLSHSNGLTVVGDNLNKYVRQQYGITTPVLTLTNAVNKELFKPMDRKTCRHKLGLPDNKILIGTAGALNTKRDIRVLYQVFAKIHSENNNVHLVLAGSTDSSTPVPKHASVHYLGNLPHHDIPAVYNALDVGVICNRDSVFGRFCFPQKFYEMLSCHTPVVAANIGELKNLLHDHPESTYESADENSLYSRLQAQITNPRILQLNTPGWNDLASLVYDFLSDVRYADS